MTSATTTSGVAGAVTGAAFLQAVAASASAIAKAAAASEKIPRDLSQFRCDLIRPSIMLKCGALGEDSSAERACLALFSSQVLVKRSRRIRDGTQAEKNRQPTVRRGRKRDPDHNPARSDQAQG